MINKLVVLLHVFIKLYHLMMPSLKFIKIFFQMLMVMEFRIIWNEILFLLFMDKSFKFMKGFICERKFIIQIIFMNARIKI